MRFFGLALACAAAAVPGVPPSPAAAALQLAVSSAISAGAPAFLIPPGTYFFGDSALILANASHIDIGGAVGASPAPTLLFSPGFGVAIQSSSSLTLHDVDIDYSPLPYVFGGITAIGSSTTVLLDPVSLTFEQLAAQYPPHDIWPPVSAFSRATGDLLGSLCSWGSAAPATPLGGGSYRIACGSGSAAVGDSLVAATRIGYTLTLSQTSRVTIRDVHLYAASYMAITEFQGDGGNVYERVHVAPRNSSRPLGSNADGLHSSGMRTGPTLRNISIVNLLDDFFNVHNTFQIVVARESATSVLLGDYQLFPGGDTLYGTQQTLSRVQPGESISFFPLNTFSYPGLATASIASITEVTGPAAQTLLASAHANASALAKKTPCSACHAGLNPYATAQLWRVAFAGAALPPAVTALVLANADGISGTGASIDGAYFSGSASNIGRFKSSGGRVTNTVWRNTLSQNFEVEPLQNWLEGMLGIHDIVIANNTFYGTATSPVHTFGAANITVVNNTFIAA